MIIEGYILRILPPTVVVSLSAYLIRFFGRIIVSQRVYSEDRDWDAELSGVTFFSTVCLLPTVLGIGGGMYFDFLKILGHWSSFVVLGVLTVYLLAACVFITDKVGWIRFSILDSFEKKKELQELIGACWRFIDHTDMWVLYFIGPFFLSLIGTLEYKNFSPLWFIYFSVQIFSALILLTSNYSLLMNPSIKAVKIMLTDVEPIEGATLLRTNDQEIRIQVDNKILVIPKSRVKCIEMNAPKLELPLFKKG